MKTLAVLFAISAGACAQNLTPSVTNARFESRAFSGNLATQIRARAATWFGYSIQTMPGDHSNCCWNQGVPCGWRPEALAAGSVHLEASPEIDVLFRVENDNVEKMEVYSADCPLEAGGLPFIWIRGVPAKASLAYLRSFVSASAADHVLNSAMLAISMHADAQADGILEQLARPAESQRIREQAIFWMGVNRGARGVAGLKEILEKEASEQIRVKAVFALSISKQPTRST